MSSAYAPKDVIAKPVQMWTDLRKQAETAACSSGFYHWMLSKGTVPQALAVKLIDPWPGSADRGRSLCNGIFAPDGVAISYYGDLWCGSEDMQIWFDQLHSFSWLRDLRAMGGDLARRMARFQVDRWIDKFDRWDADSWRADLTGQRIAQWLVLYDFFCASAEDRFQQRYFTCLIRQSKHLSRVLSGVKSGIDLLRAAKGLVYAGLAFPGRESWIIQGIEAVMHDLPHQVLSDGGHVSRSPQNLVETLQILLDLRCALHKAALPVPDVIQHAIDRAGQGVRFFRYADKKLALFHGTLEGDAQYLDALLSQAGGSKALKSLPETGFERIVQGRSLLMVDAGKIPSWPHDRDVHGAPAAFEFAYGRERIFTNCGTHAADMEWRGALRGIAAHNSLSLDHKNILDVHDDGHTKRQIRQVSVERTETRESCLLDVRHDAYVPQNGVSHRRRFYLCQQGHDLRGEETLTADLAPAKPVDVTVRFHIHPRVLVSLVQDGQEALLRLPSGIGWRFYVVGGKLSLENSVYMGADCRPIKTKQLVIQTEMTKMSMVLKWALQREGI